MINLAESFWSIPEHLWDDWFVHVRWSDFPDPGDSVVDWRSEAEYVSVAEVVAGGVKGDYGFRSLSVGGANDGSVDRYFSPILLDLDLDGDTQANLDALLSRVVERVESNRWRYRAYRSGVGYHVELDPGSFDPWAVGGWRVKEVVGEMRSAAVVTVSPFGGTACIDKPEGKMLRMVGSRNHHGGRKVRIYPAG